MSLVCTITAGELAASATITVRKGIGARLSPGGARRRPKGAS